MYFIAVYIYPPEEYFIEGEGRVLEMSQEMYEMLEAVYTSEHYTPDPAAASSTSSRLTVWCQLAAPWLFPSPRSPVTWRTLQW